MTAATTATGAPVFDRARGAELRAEDGRLFVDLTGAGGLLTPGHNHPRLRRRLLAHLAADAVGAGAGLPTSTERELRATFARTVLAPAGLDLDVHPVGGDPLATALRFAAERTGRDGVVAFTGSHDRLAGAPGTVFIEHGRADLARLAHPAPAAVVVEPVQAEGLHEGPAGWLAGLRAAADETGALLVVDETATAGGRTGPYFAFQHSGALPDVVITSAPTGGYGPPLALLLLRGGCALPGATPLGDGVGDQLALVAAITGCELWAEGGTDRRVVARRVERFRAEVAALPGVAVRGRGLLLGLELGPVRAEAVRAAAFTGGVLVGRSGAVLTATPAPATDLARLDRGLRVLHRALLATRPDHP
ncbi:aminotransferase class III-fold pyridoxal phosphate-dependent enzyme [Actinokineospora bangkokensis]|uniref:Diaminobutyrate--2-oxoglutarate transaminase n=1 Tax=Actinokineospora bangkokensis TaxID=1193682 RepID=A0A1Q9LLZ8_9PSEU|nr:aminotransferase class III-fold pyridoxal phosphate-dependent enzyme [Actinokineospora bangkokensis]OLR93066.1 hypothetical protein BJP25_19135 [Actinokineospora bangkokensis]